ncbi:MAG: hypothetical protein KJ950_15050 [Proteobacteria bacterium]|nr:hypothetical protein [Pseudomonadota bacterium]MBU1688653.1 hypothetical protein [Pseudomonadota bacterium]
MTQLDETPPALIIDYYDHFENFQGWLVIDRLEHRICAGGMRVQPGLTREHLIRMAKNMTRKMRIAGLRVDGAKCGISYDPTTPGKQQAVQRFMAAIAPYIKTIYSMGPDLNIDMTELENASRTIGLPSVKMSIAAAQGWDDDYFLKRSSVLSEEIQGIPLGRLRAGYGVSAAALGLLDDLAIPRKGATIAMQGFGALAKAALFGLREVGARIVAIADAEKCYTTTSDHGISISWLLDQQTTLLPPPGSTELIMRDRNEILNIDCDLMIPVALENTIPPEAAEKLPAKGVVPGANLAVPQSSADILFERRIPVLPDFLAGCGGSLSMEGLYGPDEHPSPREVLDHVRDRMTLMVQTVMEKSRADQSSPTEAALGLCGNFRPQPGTRPYGRPF